MCCSDQLNSQVTADLEIHTNLATTLGRLYSESGHREQYLKTPSSFFQEPVGFGSSY
jgi:hypothetical protein